MSYESDTFNSHNSFKPTDNWREISDQKWYDKNDTKTYYLSLTKLLIPSFPAAILSDMETKTAGVPEIVNEKYWRVIRIPLI